MATLAFLPGAQVQQRQQQVLEPALLQAVAESISVMVLQLPLPWMNTSHQRRAGGCGVYQHRLAYSSAISPGLARPIGIIMSTGATAAALAEAAYLPGLEWCDPEAAARPA
jgi:hypothetical protein